MGKIGRPTKYREEYCERVIEMGSKGMSPVEWADEFGVVRSTLNYWAEKHPKFSKALNRGREACQAWYILKGREGMTMGKDWNDRQWWRMVTNLFRDDWVDARNVNVRGAIVHLDQDQLARLPDPLLSRIAGGEDPTAVLASVAGDVLGHVTAGEEGEVPEAEVVDGTADEQKAPEEDPGG